jgi:hypothetical protein
MGFFDTVKDKAGALATDAGRAGRVTAAQARLVVLQNDLRKAERELGQAAFALAERGGLDHPDLASAVERLRAIAAEVGAKEAEIAALRNEPLTPAPGPSTEAPATPAAAIVETVSGPVTVTVAADEAIEAAAPEPAAAVPQEEVPAVPPGAADRPDAGDAGAPEPTKPAPRKTAAKAGGAAAEKPPAKKPSAGGKATARKTAAKAGATPKKSSRPRPGPQPAGKKRPAGT